MSLSGRTAIVTGAASGLGRASAIALAEADANVVVAGLDPPGLRENEGIERNAAEIRDAGGSAIAVETDISSITFFVGFENLIHYVSSKGVVGFTRALPREVGPQGIRVNAIAPGAFPTRAEEIHPDPEALNRMILERQALKRRGRPEDIANAVTFLAGDASSFITGQTLLVDGGWYMH